MAEIVTVEAIGHRGDGVFRTAEGPAYVPFTLPGERVAVERKGERGRLLEILEPSPERASPPCRHFGRCGGCALQMMALPATRRLKRDLAIAALAREGLHPEVAETVGVSAASRRRAVLTAVRTGAGMVLGYSERQSNRIVDIAECPILTPALAANLPGLRGLIGTLVPGRKPVRVTALLTRGGLDLNLEGAPAPAARAIPKLVEMAGRHKIARVSIGGEPVLTLAEPVVEIAGVPLLPPPGAFLQASAEAEAAMAEIAAGHLRGAKRIADLFSGLGTFALALARFAPVLAVESSEAALDALSAATRHADGLKRIDTERRDLFAFPLSPAELNRFDAAVFDPPRAGAKAQAEALAASAVRRIAAISCNPASFARDARILVDGGYRLERVVPVDQFVYAAETEVVGLFSRIP